jgi:hypothetical protein
MAVGRKEMGLLRAAKLLEMQKSVLENKVKKVQKRVLKS